MKISEIITDKYKLRIPPTVYYDLLADVVEAEEEQEPKTGHWINKQSFIGSCTCSAECSSCHKRSNGYMHDNGYSLESMYYDFCPKCGSDNREVVEE